MTTAQNSVIREYNLLFFLISIKTEPLQILKLRSIFNQCISNFDRTLTNINCLHVNLSIYIFITSYCCTHFRTAAARQLDSLHECTEYGNMMTRSQILYSPNTISQTQIENPVNCMKIVAICRKKWQSNAKLRTGDTQ